MKRFSGRGTRREIFLLSVALMLMLGLLMGGSFLSQSFWLDETISAWITRSSVRDAFDLTLRFQGQSPLYYVLLWGYRLMVGNSEVALRSLSVCFLCIAAFYVFIIGRCFFNLRAALFAVLIFCCVDAVQLAMSARPYALALAAALGSFYHLHRWLESNRPRDLMLWALFAMLSFYAHYLFAAFFVVHALLLLQKWKPSNTRSSGAIAIVTVIMALISVPGFMHLYRLWVKSASLAFAPEPDLARVFLTVFPKEVFVPLGLAMIAAVIVFPSRLRRNLTPQQTALILSWWVMPIAVFGFHAALSKGSLFMERYFLWYVPAIVFFCVMCFESFENARARYLATALFVLFGIVRLVDRQWKTEDWRGAVQLVVEKSREVKIPVLLYSGLIESERPSFADERDREYLSVPFTVYAPELRAGILPSQLGSLEQRQYFEGSVWPVIESAEEVLLIVFNKSLIDSRGNQSSVSDFYREYFAERLYTWEELKTGLVRVVLLKKGHAGK